MRAEGPMDGERFQLVVVGRGGAVGVNVTDLLGGAGGLEAAIAALALRDQVLPPTINYETPDPECDLDYVPNRSRPASFEYALTNSFGFGGTNACLVLKRYAQ